MSKSYWLVKWMEAKNPQETVYQSWSGAKDKAVDMSEMWGIAEVFEFPMGETDQSKYVLKSTFGKGQMTMQQPPVKPGDGLGGAPNLLNKEDNKMEMPDLPDSLNRKKNGIKPMATPAPAPKAAPAPAKASAKVADVPETSTQSKEDTMTTTNTEAATKAPAKKAPVKAPAKKAAPAKAPAKKAPAKKAPAKAPAKKAAPAKKEAKPAKEAKPYAGPHPELYNAMKLRDGSKTAKVAQVLLKNLNDAVKISKLQEAVYGSADAEGADGITMRINCVKLAITNNKVKAEVRGDRKTKDKEGTVGIFTK